jgi:tRNA uridine 5-carboxymethylaminomethyl modification enzyme
LHLRIDNADERLTEVGRSVGLVQDDRWAAFKERQYQKALLREWLFRERVRVVGDTIPAAVWLRRPTAKIDELAPKMAEALGVSPARGVLTTLETEVKYEGYLRQQERQMERLRDGDCRGIPEEFAYSGVPGLSREVQEKLSRVSPRTLGQAARIPGVTPAAIAVLEIYLRLRR